MRFFISPHWLIINHYALDLNYIDWIESPMLFVKFQFLQDWLAADQLTRMSMNEVLRMIIQFDSSSSMAALGFWYYSTGSYYKR
jgi:hypothetical protein